MSVRRVSPRRRPAVLALTMALVLGGWLSSSAMVGGLSSEAAADPSSSPASTTSTTVAPTTTTTPPPTTTPSPTTTTTGVPPTSTTVNVPRTTTVPGTSTSVPQAVAPTTNATAPQSQAGASGPVALAVVVSTGDGLKVRSTDGSERQPQVGESLQQGDQLSTTGSTNSSSTPNPVTIRWLQGGMTDIYDATPRIFVHGHKSVPPVATTITIDANPTPQLRVSQGFVRFWFPPAEKGWYSFVASTESVVATVKGTDFTIGDDPASKTSTVGVTQDSVEVAPVNPSLQAFQLSAGSQVQVTTDQVGPITPLADQSATGARPSSRSSTTTNLALWLVGLLLTVAVVSSAVGLASLWRERQHREPGKRARRHAPPRPTLPPRPVPTPDLSFAHAGPPGHTQWVTLPAGPSGDDTEPVAATRHEAQAETDSESEPDRSKPAGWQPTHRVPPEGMKARAIPVADAGDVADLDPNLAVRLVEHRGEWANVLSADGWSGWVEARQLRPEPDSA
jgi:hypothetical protein